MPPVIRSIRQPIITRAIAETINCEPLYSGFKERLRTNSLSLSIRGCVKTPFGYSLQSNRTYIPNVSRMLSTVIPPGFSYFVIEVDYREEKLNRDVKMSRAEFLMEQL